jgi:hypothetical protein
LFTLDVFAAPLKSLPSALTAAFSQQAFIEDVLAAPDNGLPSLLTGLAQDEAAIAEPAANMDSKPTRTSRVISFSILDTNHGTKLPLGQPGILRLR